MTTHLCVEHLALRAQTIALRNQVINFLPSLQYTLDGLVQHNLCLVQLLLNLHDTVCLLWVLVFDNVVFQLGVAECVFAGAGEGGAWVFGEKLVADLGKELMGDQLGVLFVGDYDAADTFGPAVGVECVC